MLIGSGVWTAIGAIKGKFQKSGRNVKIFR
jgi:hypothetical protein